MENTKENINEKRIKMGNKKIIFIGGSPCSGKSTIAERISKDYGAYYFKVDNILDELINYAAEQGFEACKRSVKMKPDEMWFRNPLIQCKEEFAIYDEIADYVFDRLEKPDANFIVTEGVAYTPKVMKKHNFESYIAIIPTSDFQIEHYKKRDWVSYVLQDCSDKELAFTNWMQRDILFARLVKEECEQNGIPCILNDGTYNVDELFEKVKRLFKL